MPSLSKLSDMESGKGKLIDMGWPSPGAIVNNVRMGKTPYNTAIKRLQYLVNINSPAALDAKRIIKRLQQEFRPGGVPGEQLPKLKSQKENAA